MNRSEALELLAREQRVVPEGAEYTLGRFEPADAPGVTRLFYATYGDGYPIDTYYIPEKLAEENRNGNIHSVVARTVSGDIISHLAFYRSSPPNPHLYEYGLALTLRAYRGKKIHSHLIKLLMELAKEIGIDTFYVETACNHLTIQQFCTSMNMLEAALEPALMPARTYEAEQSADGRVGCLLAFRVDKDCRRKLHIPASYRNELTFLLNGLNLDRELVDSDANLTGSKADIEVTRFEFAGVARCIITSPGADLSTRLAELERELRGEDYALIQFFVDLGKAWSGGVVELLRAQGYCLGGLLPVWFEDDGLLMQKHFVDPEFDSLKILTDRGRSLLEMVKRDWERSKR
ncbi:MAG: GNAT family N-acetyltransferase [Desulfuromonas sp.]|nr:GNAT family N-acetyltransferase [Desulfuromonas sp.]